MKIFIKIIFIATCFIFLCDKAEAVTVRLEYPFVNSFDKSDSIKTSISILKDEIKKSPENYNLHFVLGELLIMQKDFDKAKEEFLNVLKMKPDHYLSYITLGYITLEVQNKPQDAIDYFEKAVQYAPDKAVVYNTFAIAYILSNKFREAVDVLEKGIQRIENDESLYFNQTLILLEYFEGDEAGEKVIRNMEKAIRLSPKEEYYFILGNYYLSKKNNDKAKNAFEHTIKINSKNVYAILGVATTYKNAHAYEKAIDLANDALKIEPNNADIQKEIEEYKEEYKRWKEKQLIPHP